MKTSRLIPLLFLALALPATAEVYKCRQPDGRTEISSEPCAAGSSTVRTMQDDVVPEASREQAERNADRMRRQADQMQADRLADEAQARRDAEAQRKASGLPSPAVVQQCLNTVSRMNIDSSRRAELESGCSLTGRIEPVYNETYQQPVYYGGGYYRPYPRPVPPVAPVPPAKPGKPVDLYKVPAAPRGAR